MHLNLWFSWFTYLSSLYLTSKLLRLILITSKIYSKEITFPNCVEMLSKASSSSSYCKTAKIHCYFGTYIFQKHLSYNHLTPENNFSFCKLQYLTVAPMSLQAVCIILSLLKTFQEVKQAFGQHFQAIPTTAQSFLILLLISTIKIKIIICRLITT